MKKCPKCNYSRRETDDQLTPITECPSCGIIYSKYEDFIRKKKNATQENLELNNKSIAEETVTPEEEIDKSDHDKKIKILQLRTLIDLPKKINIKYLKEFTLPAKLTLIGIASILSIIIFNYMFLQRHMNDVISNDPRNKGVSVDVHYWNYINTKKLIYNLDGLSPNNSRADVFRILLQFAEEISSKKFNHVILACKGETKFYLKGDYFNKIGAEYSMQNPVYTMRTFPENVYSPTGEKAFSSWSGGLLGVVNKQMDDFNSFHDQWYWASIPKNN